MAQGSRAAASGQADEVREQIEVLVDDVIAARATLDSARAGDHQRRGGGGKLSRSETVTVRLDPKLRYLAELAARLHRRTLSSYIEWAVKESLEEEPLRPVHLAPGLIASDRTIGSEAEYLWDVDDADRFAKLALRYPHLLSHEEQVRWKLIRENGYLWKGSYAGRRSEWTWTVDEDSLNYPRLREHWATFGAVADGTAGQDRLPTWATTDPARPNKTSPVAAPAPKSGWDEFGDDIPF